MHRAMKDYIRPLVQTGPARPLGAQTLAGGWAWFTHVEVLSRDVAPKVIPASDLTSAQLAPLITPRVPMAGMSMTRPNLMGILNVTPDSFSDGGRFAAPEQAISHARAMAEAGADILDIGGESTRPGAEEVPVEVEIARTAPVIAALRGALETPISIDTRKSLVATAALQAGANLVNDVAAMTFDPAISKIAADVGAPICLMHAQGDPQTMQDAPSYANVVLDVFDFLEERIIAAEQSGIPRHRISIDPGIGFGKTLEHNLALLQRLSIFHSLGCPILLGVSRKRFIGTLANEPQADRRMPGSVAVALAGVHQGAQILRVHDLAETRQALTLFIAVTGGFSE